jgi:hypothetical protein
MTVSVPKEPLPDVSHVVRILFPGVRIVTEVAKLHDSVKFPYCLPIMPEHNKNKIGQLPTPRHVLSDKVPVKDSLAWLQAVLNFLDYVAAFLVLFHVSHVHLAVIMQLSRSKQCVRPFPSCIAFVQHSTRHLRTARLAFFHVFFGYLPPCLRLTENLAALLMFSSAWSFVVDWALCGMDFAGPGVPQILHNFEHEFEAGRLQFKM